MTKEETIKIIEYTFLNADGHLKPLDFDYGGGKGIVEALRMAIEALSQLSLPSNLDEAANNYGVDIRLGYPRVMDETDKYIYNAFKAGQSGWRDKEYQCKLPMIPNGQKWTLLFTRM